MKRTACIVLCLLAATAAHAQSASPIVYSKTVIRIIPQTAQPVPDKDKSKQPAVQPSGSRFTVEVRPLRFLEQKDFFTRRSFSGYEGMLILIDPPAEQPLKASNIFGKVDVLFVKEDGTIARIAPAISLSGLPSPIDSETPIHAFVIIQAGMAKIANIEPGDRIENSLFRKSSSVVEVPPAIAVQPTPSTPASEPPKAPQTPAQTDSRH